MNNTDQKPEVKQISFSPPNRDWYPTGRLNEWGKPMFASREWDSEEREKYREESGAQK